MRSAMCGLTLVSGFLISLTASDALAESMPALGSSSIHSSGYCASEPKDQQPVDPNAAIHVRTAKASAGLHQDTGVVIRERASQDPSPVNSKSSLWQWLGGRKVDCSSGVCIVR